MNDLININISTLHRGKAGPAQSGSASDNTALIQKEKDGAGRD